MIAFFFEGFFVEGRRQGIGIYHFASGEVYTGEFVDGRLEGEGELEFKNGSVYYGQFKNNMKHGKGVFKLTTVSILTKALTARRMMFNILG